MGPAVKQERPGGKQDKYSGGKLFVRFFIVQLFCLKVGIS